MSQSEPPHSSESNSRRRTRRPSPSDQSRPRKRQRQSPTSRIQSTATRIDHGQLVAPRGSASTTVSATKMRSETFASYPQTFTSFPQPHGSQRLHEPAWELRFDHEIHLSNNFLSEQTRWQRVREPVPGPETDPLLSYSPPQPAPRPPTRAAFGIEKPLSIFQYV